MTNMCSGSKRSWDGVEAESHKRPRERDEPKDWRDVHLKSPRRKIPIRRDNLDRRGSDYGGHGRSKGVDRRSSDYGRDKARREDRDRERDREHHTRRDDASPEDVRRNSISSRDRRLVHAGHDDSEKEEGE